MKYTVVSEWIGVHMHAVVQVGMALNDKRVIASIGDGSFQVTAQDLSTMMREGELLQCKWACVHDVP